VQEGQGGGEGTSKTIANAKDVAVYIEQEEDSDASRFNQKWAIADTTGNLQEGGGIKGRSTEGCAPRGEGDTQKRIQYH